MWTKTLPAAVPVALAWLVAALAGEALAGEAQVTARSVADLKAVFGRIESRDTVPARVRTGGTLLSRSVEEGKPLELAYTLRPGILPRIESLGGYISALRNIGDSTVQ